MTGGQPEWVIREDAAIPVLIALYLRQVCGIRSPEELPALRRVPGYDGAARRDDEQALLEREWREFWAMSVEPLAHPSPVPLELVEGSTTCWRCRSGGPRRCARRSHRTPPMRGNSPDSPTPGTRRRARARPGVSYRAYASAIAVHERRVGRRAHSFELNVQVLPLAQRGVWWIGSLTVAVTDGLRSDVVAFDAAIHPIIAELA